MTSNCFRTSQRGPIFLREMALRLRWAKIHTLISRGSLITPLRWNRASRTLASSNKKRCLEWRPLCQGREPIPRMTSTTSLSIPLQWTCLMALQVKHWILLKAQVNSNLKLTLKFCNSKLRDTHQCPNTWRIRGWFKILLAQREKATSLDPLQPNKRKRKKIIQSPKIYETWLYSKTDLVTQKKWCRTHRWIIAKKCNLKTKLAFMGMPQDLWAKSTSTK